MPAHLADPLARIETGRARAGRTGPFDVVALVPTALGPDVHACADRLRPLAALYLGGMGTVTQNFYARQAERLGYAEATAQVGAHFRAGRLRDAAAAVPFEFLDATCLLGDDDRVADRLRAFAEAGVTTLAVAPMAGDVDTRLAEVATVVRLAAAG
jgi:alkanesulfonate monooxygenase SsuD/methylene tetrahydromethanopterin reductase-like flavin-dependent oxidoreductase (luciferase family)